MFNVVFVCGMWKFAVMLNSVLLHGVWVLFYVATWCVVIVLCCHMVYGYFSVLPHGVWLFFCVATLCVGIVLCCHMCVGIVLCSHMVCILFFVCAASCSFS